MRSQSTLLLTAEDGWGDTVRPRLDALGADLARIKAIRVPLVFDEIGLQKLETVLRFYKPDLVVVDPLVAYFGGKRDLHRANETREVMARLANLAQRYRCAIVCIRHLTKSTRSKSVYRGIGSIDLTAAARSVLLVGEHPEKGRGFVHIKSNLAPKGLAIGFTLEGGKFEWTGISFLTARTSWRMREKGSPWRSLSSSSLPLYRRVRYLPGRSMLWPKSRVSLRRLSKERSEISRFKATKRALEVGGSGSFLLGRKPLTTSAPKRATTLCRKVTPFEEGQ